MTLYDVYDFDRKVNPFRLFKSFSYLKQRVINALDTGEKLGVVSNFEIQVDLIDYF